MEDVPAVCAMLAAGTEIDKPFSPPSEGRLTHLYGLLGERLEQNTLLALGRDGDVVAAGFIYFPPGEEAIRLALVNGHVHVQQRRCGLGSFILSWLEARARQEFGEPEDGIAQLLRTSCAAHQSDRITLFEKHGFTAARYSYTMQRDLERLPPPPSLPADVELFPWDPSLDGAVMRAFRRGFPGTVGCAANDPRAVAGVLHRRAAIPPGAELPGAGGWRSRGLLHQLGATAQLMAGLRRLGCCPSGVGAEWRLRFLRIACKCSAKQV